MPETSAPERATYRHIEIRDLDPDGLVKLSDDMKLSLSREDMLVIQSFYAADMRREPTDVELYRELLPKEFSMPDKPMLMIMSANRAGRTWHS